MLQELSGKDQEKVAEVSRVRVELQEQIGHLHAERTAQGGLKEKISALEREIKGVPPCFLYIIIFSSGKKFISMNQKYTDTATDVLTNLNAELVLSVTRTDIVLI